MTTAVRRDTPARGAPLTAIALLVAVLVAACGAATGTPTPTPATGSATPATGSGSPGTASASPGASASEALVGPSPTSWPGDVVEATVILGKADLEIQKAGGDLGAAAAYEDLPAMWGAADGLATLIEKLQGQVDRIRDYPETAAAAKAYDAAFPDMLAGAKGIRDAIDAKDGAALTGAVAQLGQGTAKYAEARRLIAPLFDQAILMQRVLVK